MSAIWSTMSMRQSRGTPNTSASSFSPTQRRPSPTSRLGRCGSCSAGRRARPDGRCPMAIAPVRRVEPHSSRRGRYFGRGRAVACRRRRVPQRHRERAGRIADPAEGPFRQSRRVVSAGSPLIARVRPLMKLDGRVSSRPPPARRGSCASRTTAGAGCCCIPGCARCAAGSRIGGRRWAIAERSR